MDTPGFLTMSTKELNRLEVLNRALERRLTQAQAAEQLGLSTRQVERLCRRLREDGPRGLVSKKRGKPSNRKLSGKFRSDAVALVASRYRDFGPTLAAEKLASLHGMKVSVETLRRWMVEEDLWVPRAQRQRVHQPRHRRACVGELIQIDGCDHEWFEERALRCTLLVYVDDATSRLMELLFVPSESTFSYFAATRRYLESHGKPVAFYSDKAGVFRINAANKRKPDGMTQFGRALSDLNIDIICASTPQAKGRVERAHLTLQDRLVKELRLEGISSVAEANAYAPRFIEFYNERFGKEPLSPQNVHRPVREDEDLGQILCWQEDRKVSKQLTLHYRGSEYLIEPSPETMALRGRTCRVYADADGQVEIRRGERSIPFRAFNKLRRVSQADIVSNKRLGAVLTQIQADQRKRDAETLSSPNVSLRRKRRIRAARTHADAPLGGS
ncbi:MAG: ISNCY family transposase [Deltaproteobacteria bacterium]|nr:ISNCY family transposase [Deltaproteobacteria bacterium]